MFVVAIQPLLSKISLTQHRTRQNGARVAVYRVGYGLAKACRIFGSQWLFLGFHAGNKGS
jgi:hypothetical protein